MTEGVRDSMVRECGRRRANSGGVLGSAQATISGAQGREASLPFAPTGDRVYSTGMLPRSSQRGGRQDGAPHLLVVNGDAQTRWLLLDALIPEGYRVDAVEDGAQALIRLHAEPFAAIIMDHDLPGVQGLDLLPGLRLAWPETPVIITCRLDDAQTCSAALERGAHACLAQPFRMEHLLRTLRQVLIPACPAAAPRLASGEVR